MRERNIEEYEKEYLEAPFLKENVKYRRRCVLEQISKYKSKKILEIGCGMFPIFTEVEKVCDKCVIVEPSALFAENAEKIAEKVDENKIKIYKGYFEDVAEKLINETFDFIICSSLLHEVQDEQKLLDAIYKVASKETIVHFNVPNALSLHRLIAESAGMINSIYDKSETQKRMQQRSVYDLNTLKQIMMEKGFKIIDEGSFFIKPFTHKQMDDMLKMGIINENVLEGLWNLIKYFPENGSEIFVNVKKY